MKKLIVRLLLALLVVLLSADLAAAGPLLNLIHNRRAARPGCPCGPAGPCPTGVCPGGCARPQAAYPQQYVLPANCPGCPNGQCPLPRKK